MNPATAHVELEEAVVNLQAVAGADTTRWIDTARHLSAAGFLPWQLDLLAGYGPQTTTRPNQGDPMTPDPNTPQPGPVTPILPTRLLDELAPAMDEDDDFDGEAQELDASMLGHTIRLDVDGALVEAPLIGIFSAQSWTGTVPHVLVRLKGLRPGVDPTALPAPAAPDPLADYFPVAPTTPVIVRGWPGPDEADDEGVNTHG